MSKRARVPAPFRRLHPSVVRGFGPRLLLVASASAALLLIGGSSYVLSHVSHSAPAPKPQAHVRQPAPQDAKVLGAATTTPDTTTPPSDATSAANTPAPITTPSAPATAPHSTGPICALTCIPGLAVAAPEPSPSFELVVDTASASRGLLSINIPFHVVRRGGLSAAIQPLHVTVTVGGSPTSLLRVQATRMTDSDHGVITMVNLGLPAAAPIAGQLSAQSAGLTSSASFSL